MSKIKECVVAEHYFADCLDFDLHFYYFDFAPVVALFESDFV